MSALACSPQPAGLPMPTPRLLPQVQTPEFATKMHKCLRVYKQRHRELSCTVMQADQICTTQKRKHVQSIAAWLHTMFAKIKLIVKNEL